MILHFSLLDKDNAPFEKEFTVIWILRHQVAIFSDMALDLGASAVLDVCKYCSLSHTLCSITRTTEHSSSSFVDKVTMRSVRDGSKIKH